MNFVKKFKDFSNNIIYFKWLCISSWNKYKSIKKNINKKINNSQYSMEDVGINIIKINSMSETDINFYNKKNTGDRL